VAARSSASSRAIGALDVLLGLRGPFAHLGESPGCDLCHSSLGVGVDIFACANIEESLSESAAIITFFAHADRLAVLPVRQSNSLSRDGPLTT
jgi:hypothetical protein